MRAVMPAAIALITVAAALAATGPAAAKPKHKPAHVTHAPAAKGDGTQRPVDVGPFTPEANRAYQGGGVSLPATPRP